MKSVKEFVFLSKRCGFFYAVFYLLHKIDFKVMNSGPVLSWKRAKKGWMEKITNALFYYENNVARINNREYLQLNVEGGAGVYLRPFSSDRDVYLQVFINEDYKSVVDIYEQVFKKKPVSIIDCGSNIGLTSVYLKKYYPDASLIAVEPFKDNAELIKLNFDRNKLGKTTVLEGGIWNAEGKLAIKRDFRDGKEWSIGVGPIEIGASNEEITAYSILNIIEGQEEAIDILKIDVEGSEKILFSDIQYSKRFLKKVKCVAIEIHDEFDCRDDIYAAFRESNFFYYNISDMTIAINRSFMS